MHSIISDGKRTNDKSLIKQFRPYCEIFVWGRKKKRKVNSIRQHKNMCKLYGYKWTRDLNNFPLSFCSLQNIKDSFSGWWLHVHGVHNADVWQSAGITVVVRD